MKEIIKPMYQCDHCKKWYHNKHACIKHEERCFNNPANARPCFNCSHLEKVKYTLYEDHPYVGEVEREIEIFQCSKTNNFLHTPQNEIKGNAYELGEDINHPMPKVCEIYDKDQKAEVEFFNKLKFTS